MIDALKLCCIMSTFLSFQYWQLLIASVHESLDFLDSGVMSNFGLCPETLSIVLKKSCFFSNLYYFFPGTQYVEVQNIYPNPLCDMWLKCQLSFQGH